MLKQQKTIVFILGIRPDIIRAALILKHLKSDPTVRTLLVWSGQHYSDNLKDIFFRELDIQKPDYELNCKGSTDAEICSALISQLYPLLEQVRPDAAVFLGDTNTTAGAMACAQLNIPIVHIEGCMRSYDWEMPEEKYRTSIDHLSDVIYAYFDEYKEQGVREGLNPNRIVVVGNPIVDILNEFYFQKTEKFKAMASSEFFTSRGLKQNQYFVMTCHRRENVHSVQAMKNIIELLKRSPHPVYFPASYRTQKVLKEENLVLPAQVKMVDPVGYDELICLMANSQGVITDSGTLVEESCVLGVPSVQMRRSTERPQTYDVGSSVKFDPRATWAATDFEKIFLKLDLIRKNGWKHTLGDGKTSERIAKDLLTRAEENTFRGHLKELYHFTTDRSYRDDGIKL